MTQAFNIAMQILAVYAVWCLVWVWLVELFDNYAVEGVAFLMMAAPPVVVAVILITRVL